MAGKEPRSNEVSDMWKAYHAKSKKKREHNRECGIKQLNVAGINFRTLNEGYHIVIEEGERIDYWPTTGTWKVSGTTGSQRGIRSLLTYLLKGRI